MTTRRETDASDRKPAAVTANTPQWRWLIGAMSLGSGLAFLDSTVVNVALPALRHDLGGGLSVQQWVLDGYLLTLSALLLLCGALGDRYGRKRVFLLGIATFSLASLGCAAAPTAAVLVGLRAVQGVGAALLVPGSLALIDALVEPRDRGRAIGVWAGLSGVATAVGPPLGGWLTQAVSWRWIFLINLPIAAAAAYATGRHVPESRENADGAGVDWQGGALISIGLAGIVYTLIQLPLSGWTPLSTTAVIAGAVCIASFLLREAWTTAPMLPLSLFRSAAFTGANLTTLAVYAALNGALFLLSLQLQQSLHYSPLAAGFASLPITVLMLLLSPRAGALAQRIGPRIPMTAGPITAGIGLALMARITPGAGYLSAVLPAVVVFGLGLALTVAPLTAAVLAAVPEDKAGLASGTNNAVARAAGLFAVAVLPLAAGADARGAGLGPAFGRAMVIAACLCVLGGLIAGWLMPGTAAPKRR
jgi:EmrB/QacA subfamily drug resistance transporter